MLLRKTHFCYNLQMILIIKTILLNSLKKTNLPKKSRYQNLVAENNTLIALKIRAQLFSPI